MYRAIHWWKKLFKITNLKVEGPMIKSPPEDILYNHYFADELKFRNTACVLLVSYAS